MTHSHHHHSLNYVRINKTILQSNIVLLKQIQSVGRIYEYVVWFEYFLDILSVFSPGLISIDWFVCMAGLVLIARIKVVEQVAGLTDSCIELHRLFGWHRLIVSELLPHIQQSSVIFNLEYETSNCHFFSIVNVDLVYIFRNLHLIALSRLYRSGFVLFSRTNLPALMTASPIFWLSSIFLKFWS